MKAFVDWVVSQRFWVVLLAIVFLPFGPVTVTAALLALDTAQHGAVHGSITAGCAIAALAVLAMLAPGGGVVELAGGGALVLFAGVAVGALLRWAPSVTLGFQAILLGSTLAAVAVSLFGPEPAVLMAPLIEQLVEWLRVNGWPQEALDAVPGYDTMLMGLVEGLLFAELVGAMLLSYWLLAMLHPPLKFGDQFRGLRMGRALGIPAMILISVGLVLESALVQNLAFLVFFAFLYQGLAVVHAWVYAKRWQPLLWFVYALMITPWTWLGLSVIGLLDNVFDLRWPLRAQRDGSV